jgi:hypothetical protein
MGRYSKLVGPTLWGLLLLSSPAVPRLVDISTRRSLSAWPCGKGRSFLRSVNPIYLLIRIQQFSVVESSKVHIRADFRIFPRRLNACWSISPSNDRLSGSNQGERRKPKFSRWPREYLVQFP